MSENNRNYKCLTYRTYRRLSGPVPWGTALACAAAQAGRSVLLWAREPEVIQQIQTSGENSAFLPGAQLPKSIVATGDIAATPQRPMRC